MDDLESKGKFIDIDKLSLKPPQREVTQKWVKLLKSIPPGKVFATTGKAIGGNPLTVRTKVDDYRQRGWIPKGIHVSLRQRRDGDVDIYFIHELPREKEPKESKEDSNK